MPVTLNAAILKVSAEGKKRYEIIEMVLYIITTIMTCSPGQTLLVPDEFSTHVISGCLFKITCRNLNTHTHTRKNNISLLEATLISIIYLSRQL